MLEASSEPELTLLDNNATWLSKQADKYADTCTEIAAFDWSAMFVFDFKDVNEDLASPKPVRGIFFEEMEGDKLTLRRVLLGFLIRALNRHPIMSQDSS